MPNPIRVFVCDDHTLLRQALQTFIEIEPGLLWVGGAGYGEDALPQVAGLKPDVILMDLFMPGLAEVELIHALKLASPASKILVFTSLLEEELVFSCLSAGANGYLLKNCAPEALAQAIRLVAEGSTLIPAHVSRLLAQKDPGGA